MIDENWLKLINHHACFFNKKPLHEDDNAIVAVEALKALYNIIFNSSVAVAISSKNNTIDGILERLQSEGYFLVAIFFIKVLMFLFLQ